MKAFLRIALAVLVTLPPLISCSQEPPSVPLVFIPGFAASTPKKGTILSFVFRRGAAPSTLNLSASYAPFVRSAKAAGYIDGETFFGAVYDWRMFAAPDDKDFDGNLELVTAQSVTSGNFSYAINYLGYWLNEVVQANPDAEYIDVVTHSTGGVLARSYVQSPAYGGIYTDANGVQRRLPKIRHLILGACINEGTVHSWRPWHGDFQDVLDGFIPTTEIEGRFAALAFAYVSLGGQISGPDQDITRDKILRHDRRGRVAPDETAFFRSYVPMRQSLMATTDFLLEAGAESATNVNDRPSVRSAVLLDLNALSRPGINPWARRVGMENGKGGVIATYATGAREKTKFKDFFVPGLVNQNDFIETLNGVDNLKKDEGKYLPLSKLLTEAKPSTISVEKSLFPRTGNDEVVEPLAGDGNGPFISYRSTFGGDPLIRLVQWGNGQQPLGLPRNLRWDHYTNYPVYHDVFFYIRMCGSLFFAPRRDIESAPPR